MPKISVLMSLYNETTTEIMQSISSVLKQTFSDFEFLIINDNPLNSQYDILIKSFNDNRIHYLKNAQNIGLAMSMNRLAELAKGKYLARMDADDICLHDRLEKQYAFLSNNDYDLVFGNCDIINENGEIIQHDLPSVYSHKAIEKLLPIINLFYHPTLMIKRECFFAVNGYRNFQCVQDHDLWLRLLDKGYKFHVIPDKILNYRIRENSTSIKQTYKQYLTTIYIKKLYKERKKKNFDTYSYNDYLAWLDINKVNDDEVKKKFKEDFNLFNESLCLLRRKQMIRSFYGIIKVLLFSKYYKPRIFDKVKIKLFRCLYK